jgi:NAD(P)-dependent dehydrogenase (short-subunit alcohol dehydrogenase family)
VSSEKVSGPHIVVVGASSGVGRAFASLAIREGADVVAVARRRDALEELVKEAGGGRFLTIDLADAADCARLGLEAETLLGSVDIVLFTAGTGQLKPIVLQDQKDWIQAFSVNVVGVNLAIAALLPFLAPRAIVAAVSTESVGSPHWGLASYVASKAALEESFRSWRTEHPEHRFTVIPIGTTIPTDFGKSFTQELLLEAFEKWTQVGKQTQMMEAGEVAAAIFYNLVTVLPSTSVGIEQMVIRPAAAVTGSSDVYVHHATEHKLID